MRRTTPATSKPTRRTAFTMVELMVVILVIAILVGLLLPAVQNATRNVRVAAVQNDIKQLDAAIAKFKSSYNMDPPSRIVLWEDPTQANGWNSGSPSSDAVDSRALIRQMWPRFDFTAQRDFDGDGNPDTNPIELTGGECLVFFLGGMLQREASSGRMTPTGFSKNPLNPFVLGGNREGPFFEFKTERFTDINTNNFPEYADPIPAQSAPYLYFSSYEGAGYRQRPTSATVAEFQNSTVFPRSPYRDGTLGTSPPFNSKSYQIISPGFDRLYGPGGPYNATSESTERLPAYSIDLNGDGDTSDTGETVAAAERTGEKDNITNFHSGMLQP